MIKIYGLEACKDCQAIKRQITNRDAEFTYYDLASSTLLMKEYLKLRDNNPVFKEVKENGKIGVPYFILEDQTVTLDPKDVGLKENEEVSCSIEDHLKGVKGC